MNNFYTISNQLYSFQIYVEKKMHILPGILKLFWRIFEILEYMFLLG